MKYIILFLFFSTQLCAETFTAESSASSYETVKPQKYRIDTFDFSGQYPQLEKIEIDARRKKNVVFKLTGNCPLLERVNYEGFFGTLSGKLTGNFPLLSVVNFLCTNCAMDLDLSSHWHRSCTINLRGSEGDIVLKLPQDVGLIIHTKTAARGKVIPCESLTKKGWLGLFNKTYQNSLFDTAPVVLTINVELTDGSIVLN